MSCALLVVGSSTAAAVVRCRNGTRGGDVAAAKSKVVAPSSSKIGKSSPNKAGFRMKLVEPRTDVSNDAEARPVFGALVSSAAALMLTLGSVAPAYADTPAETFTKTCAGCHAAGGNVVQAGATLFPPDLERNGVNDVETIYKLIYSGKNKMPGYGEGCQPRGQCTFGARLSDEDVKGLAQYVVDQSQKGWKD